ncbi:MAG: diguanylate cyclase [Gemmatimonadales bacterium]
MHRQTVLYLAEAEHEIPELVSAWLSRNSFALEKLTSEKDLFNAARRRLPEMIIIDADSNSAHPTTVCRALKTDSNTSVVPVVFISAAHGTDRVQEWFEAGADEVITPLFGPGEQRSRLDSVVARTRRNVAVHPTTMLPGTAEIERQILVRIEQGAQFAVCYADLDHFKEYNDRYSYKNGDRIIYLVSRILRDTVTAFCPKEGFVGHIGGDDYIMIIPVEHIGSVCKEVIDVFDTLIALQYNEEDTKAGHFLGRDRRGLLYEVPLMTISIGVVTTRNRRLTHPAYVGALATEMKSYAKSLKGSVYVIDRRSDSRVETVEEEAVPEVQES